MTKETENPFDQKSNLGNLVKKARRRSVIQTTIIAVVVSLLVVYGGLAGSKYLLNKKIETEFAEDSLWNSIHGANLRMEGTSYLYSPFSVTASTNYFKYIDGVPVPWGKKETVIPVLGSPDITSTMNASGYAQVNSDRMNTFVNGHRTIGFFHPEVTYKEKFDDRRALEKMTEADVAEMAFSFNRAYTEEEVQEVFGDSIAWMWVDTFTEERVEEHSMLNEQQSFPFLTDGGSAFGFRADGGSGSFIYSINRMIEKGGSSKSTAEEISKTLTYGEDRTLTEEDVEIIGVVVTGSSEELRAFNDEPMIAAATLGATTKNYLEND
ncbi:anti sigma factor C-terminal domain-containing protein [Jeotgalibacillus sp. ET6]|uniref:anti sigma factor C-terminal domain-containing protein n=1 Tax=Jeotgalibacillus sp. ET6 TaxID=3037260 RepID=UPI0024186529|nr:anti sigma factor C-terminal domain-containing protein [Jeotgalibacillus sp. ET6]MDG5472144.1 anti sigma factor C-terminal domain-containing protein [Jeotgalibacillus sp. ET6]